MAKRKRRSEAESEEVVKGVRQQLAMISRGSRGRVETLVVELPEGRREVASVIEEASGGNGDPKAYERELELPDRSTNDKTRRCGEFGTLAATPDGAARIGVDQRSSKSTHTGLLQERVVSEPGEWKGGQRAIKASSRGRRSCRLDLWQWQRQELEERAPWWRGALVWR